jgi:hypothetical protein
MLTLLVLVIAAIWSATSRGAPKTAEIRQLEQRVDQHRAGLHRATTTLRWFHKHPRLLYAHGMHRHRQAWQVVLARRDQTRQHGLAVRRLLPTLRRLRWQNEGWVIRPPWMDPTWWRIGICESGMNPPNWHHDGGSFEGALGFYVGSWLQFKPAGYPEHAYEATPYQQIVVAERIRARYGYTGWGCA